MHPRRAITSYVWSKKYLGLFDYEAQEVERRRYAVDGNAVVLKDQERLIPIEDRFDRNPKHTPQVLPSHPAPQKCAFPVTAQR